MASSLTPIGSVCSTSPVFEKREAIKTFWGLGDNWWKQFIDGQHHKYGPLVYDRGLHQGPTEPGFLQSIKNAADLVSKELSPQLSLERHRRVHVCACAHFTKSRESGTQISAKEAGCFRGHTTRCRIVIKDQTEEQFKLWDDRIEKTNSYIEMISAFFNLKSPLATVERINYLVYVCPADFLREDDGGWEFEKSTERVAGLITDYFNREIVKAKSGEEKFRCIAQVFQLREWLHAFSDGNTRTNLVELAGLLSAHGFNPPILDDPFEASISDLDSWVEYLKIGVKKWQEEAASKCLAS